MRGADRQVSNGFHEVFDVKKAGQLQSRRWRKQTLTVYQGRNGKWYYRKVAGNGEKTQGSQGYASASGARRAARSQNPGLEVATRRKTAARR
jgi:uncharacterized protein YegP (UPF0339 family)